MLCVNSEPGTGFRKEYRYSENNRNSALIASPLLRVNSEFVRNDLRESPAAKIFLGRNNLLVTELVF